ncbi:hypothetical protein HK102_008539, partial [Quaeritorhiza haematococci]
CPVCGEVMVESRAKALQVSVNWMNGRGEEGRMDMLKNVLWESWERNCPDEAKTNSLLAAAMFGDVKLCKRLLDEGVHVDSACKKTGDTALMTVVEYGRVKLVKLLVDRGATLQLGEPALALAEENGCCQEIADTLYEAMGLVSDEIFMGT